MWYGRRSFHLHCVYVCVCNTDFSLCVLPAPPLDSEAPPPLFWLVRPLLFLPAQSTAYLGPWLVRHRCSGPIPAIQSRPSSISALPVCQSGGWLLGAAGLFAWWLCVVLVSPLITFVARHKLLWTFVNLWSVARLLEIVILCEWFQTFPSTHRHLPV